MSIKELLVFLNLIPHLNPKFILDIRDKFKECGDLSFKEIVKVLNNILGFDVEYSEYLEKLEEEKEICKKEKIEIITIEDENYPGILRNIYLPPPVLYIKGKIDKKFRLSIVGSRNASFYGLKQAKRLSYELSLRGICIVSGLARGIDTSAHLGALEAGGITLAVLGSGLLNVYPPENRKLAEKITDKGALISEFPLHTPPYKRNFPRRNRIISGLSRGVVVVEASCRSGALITANYSLEQGKEVFCIPGNIDSPHSQGVLNLIKEGAKLVTCVEDILEEFPEMKTSLVKNPPLRESLEFSSEEREVFNFLQQPRSIEEILTKYTSPEVFKVLLNLRIRGLIEELPGKVYVQKGIWS